MRFKHVHLVGAAGAGMSALAQALIGQKYRVTGSDRYCDTGQDVPTIAKLKKAGIEFTPQDGSGVTGQTSAVVVSTAIEAGNPDLIAAEKKGVPVCHRTEMLAKLVQRKQCIGIAGTSGKSTVTGMVGWILEQAGLDPTVVNGAPVMNWVDNDRIGNVRLGNSDMWVVEMDESDRSFLNFHPEWAVITNVSADHFPLDETVALFKTFSSQVRRGIIGGIDKSQAYSSFNARTDGDGTSFTYRETAFRVPLIGRHNAENAFCALQLCEKLGVNPETARAALSSFKGIERRLQLVGRAGGVTVIDDYAHNPAKIQAAWEALTPQYRRMLAIWRPHGYKPLQMMADELVAMFKELCRPEDVLFVLPVYYAGGTAVRTVDSATFTDRLRQQGIAALLVPDYEDAAARVSRTAKEGDVALCMGARDPFLQSLSRRILESIRLKSP